MNFAAFDLNLLRVFDALMRERSVTRAGEQIGLSQPAVSQALNRLRAMLDDQLFVRRATVMAPTPRAEDIAPAVRSALALVEMALTGDKGFDPAEASRTFTLIGSDFFSTNVMPGLFARLTAEAPGVRLRLVDSARGDVERLLQDDAVDLAVERPLTVADWVSRQPLFTSSFTIIAAKGHPDLAAVAPGAPVPLDLFCRLPQAIRSIDGSIAGWTDEALASVGRERRVILALPQFFAVARTVARSRLIAAIPTEIAHEVSDELGLSTYAPPVAAGYPEISMYWHSRHDKNPAHRWLREQILAATAVYRR
jgi:DNA-binding transcriptional LysR family regulator